MRNDHSKCTGDTVLVIGRFSPLHKGHIALIKKALKLFGKVQVGIRNTPIDDKNPFTVHQRIAMLVKAFEKEIAKGTLDWVVLADLKGVVRGRKVGWKVFDLELDKDIEAISATQIRKKMRDKGEL